MRVLVVGQGAREHAIAWKLKQSPLVKEIYAAPGNAGIATVADCVGIGVADIIELADFAEKLKIDLTIVGPELPLTLGIVDEFQKRGLPIFGPTRLAAELEGSKVFSKDFMRKYGIPTAEARACSSVDEAKSALKEFGYPAVLKVGGLAGGDHGRRCRCGDRQADHHAHHSGDGERRPALHRLPLRRGHAHQKGAEGPRVQLPLRRS